MKRMWKAAAVWTLTGAMMLGMSAAAPAADAPTRDEKSSFTTGGTTATTGITEFNLIKDYDSVNKTAEAPFSSSPAETFTYEITPYGVWNAGSTYENKDNYTGAATAITAANMPMPNFGQTEAADTGENRTLTVTQKEDIGAAIYGEENDRNNTEGLSAEITLPTYDTVGDYWYKVEEKLGNTTGVFYGTNSVPQNGATTATENGGYSRTYYLHVQVTENSSTAGSSTLVSNVTLHKTAPDKGLTNAQYNVADNTGKFYTATNKVNAIENTYYAGNLVLKKVVTGNAGDKDQYFEVTVTFTKPGGTVVNSDIPFTAVAKTEADGKPVYTSTDYVIKGQTSAADTTGKTVVSWTGADPADTARTATCTFYVKDGTTVTFSNIPYGINYKIEEAKPKDDTYKHQFAFTDSPEATAPTFDGQILTADKGTADLTDTFTDYAAGSISDASDTVTITNSKDSAIDVGVFTANAPYAAMLAVALMALVIFLRRRTGGIEE